MIKIIKDFVWILLVVLNLPLFGQNIKISESLTVTKLSENTYIHTQKNNNGIVYFNNGEAVIVSTPDSEIETQNLINWVKNKARIVAYVIDRWHPDAMKGLNVVKENNIKTYANKRTKRIAKQKGLPITDFVFNIKKEIKVGNEKIICHYLGEAHTSDGIVVWIPTQKILFGGNEIRNYNGWIGNIGDANLREWSNTVKRIKKHYGTAKIVVPGHGKHDDSKLIDYTIKLYDFYPKKLTVEDKSKKIINPLKNKIVSVESKSDTIINTKRILTDAKVIVQDKSKLIIVEASRIELKDNELSIKSKAGRVQIYDKQKEFISLRTDVNFNTLFVSKLNENVGLVVVLKEITTANKI
jgi:glyoxylase-like metal-dependent hydrolase (beta-lactamase superfamily II)